MQQFLADSPWDPALVVRAVAERVAPAIDVRRGCWMTPGSRRTASARRGSSVVLGDAREDGNCQIGVSVHAVGRKGTVPLGWALYLPESGAMTRASQAKIPEVVFRPSRSSRSISSARRRLGDREGADPRRLRLWQEHALRERLHDADLSTCCRSPRGQRVRIRDDLRGAHAAPRRSGRQKTRPRPDREPEQIGELIAGSNPSTSRP